MKFSSTAKMKSPIAHDDLKSLTDLVKNFGVNFCN